VFIYIYVNFFCMNIMWYMDQVKLFKLDIDKIVSIISILYTDRLSNAYTKMCMI